MPCPPDHYCLLVGDIFWFFGSFSLSLLCLGVSRGKSDPCSLLKCREAWKSGEGGRREAGLAALLSEGRWISLRVESSRCVGVNRPSLSQLDRAKQEFSARFSDFDLEKAALPNK